MAEIPANLERVRERLARAADRSGRSADQVQLVVVSKTWPAETVRRVIDAGHLALGENKLQEAETKIPELPSEVRWHFIGRLQRNKVRKALPLFEMIHGIDSLRLARQVDRIAGELGLRPKVCLQVNLAGEASKGGFSPAGLLEAAEDVSAMEETRIMGLMCIPPAVGDPEEVRPWFKQLRELRDVFQDRIGRPLPELSMGMSHDFEIAIEEGSTMVRVGSAVFGPRLSRVEPSQT